MLVLTYLPTWCHIPENCNLKLSSVSTSLVWCLRGMDMGSFADISEELADSIFRIKVGKVGEFVCIYRFLFQKKHMGLLTHPGRWGQRKKKVKNSPYKGQLSSYYCSPLTKVKWISKAQNECKINQDRTVDDDRKHSCEYICESSNLQVRFHN